MKTYLLKSTFVLLFLATLSPILLAQTNTAEETFSFVVVGHLRSQENGKLSSLLDELIYEIEKLEPDMVFLTGDMIWGFVDKPLADVEIVTQDWKQLDSKLDQLEIPIYRVPGNHDINDPVTRDVFFERYGQLPQTVIHNNNLFLLLNSTFTPPGDEPTPKYILTSQLDLEQIDFIQNELSAGQSYNNVFLFMHHVLWWADDAPWWDSVHPMLSNTNVRAVFTGDFGPMKFSHLQRDGIDYVRSTIDDYYAIENKVSLPELHTDEKSRLLAQQFDNFLFVTVNGQDVTIEVKTLGAITSGRYSPQRWRQVNRPENVDPKYQKYVYNPNPVEPTLIERIWNIIGSPRRLLALVLITGFSFASGIAATMGWYRWKKPSKP